MKITVKKMDYAQVAAREPFAHRNPIRPKLFWRVLIRLLTIIGMAGTRFTYETERMELLKKDEPCLILMNHCCFLDMQIAHRILFPRAFNIVCTSDSYVGLFGVMKWIMHQIGGIVTQKFVTDVSLIQDMNYCFKTLGTSVLMYPEAGYSLDGTATVLPRKMGVLLKKFDVPVVMIETFGAFSRNPLYNELQVRKGVPVSAKATLLYTREEIKEKSVQELSDGLDAAFGFDHFQWQKENQIQIHDDFRADGLHRILYKCACCGAEGQMRGKGTAITCGHCGKVWNLTPLGELEAAEGETEFSHVPDWFRWQRQQVKEEILEDRYKLDIDVDIMILKDFKALYSVGQGHLVHDRTGFRLTGCEGRLDYSQKPQSSYSLNVDFYWYEMGDIISIGGRDVLYYCFPKENAIVAKARLATEEMYKLYKARVLK